MTMPMPSDWVEPITAEQLAEDSATLITLPDVYLRLKELIDSGKSTLDDIARVVSLDPGLVTRLLSIANSALYNFPSKVETVTRAVGLLGTQQVHDLVLASSVPRAFAGIPNEVMDMATFWYRSVQCGFLASTLGEGAGLRNSESLFVRGLLQDVGHLILYSRFPERCRRAMAESDRNLASLYAAEQQLVGCDANQLTTAIMRRWHLPESFLASFSHLLNPAAASAYAREVALLHIAVWISHGLDTDLLLEETLQRIDPKVWEIAELPSDVAASALDAAALETVDAMYRVLAPTP